MSTKDPQDSTSMLSIHTEKETTSTTGDLEHQSVELVQEKQNILKPEEPYTVFSGRVLFSILVTASLTGMLSPLTANIYLPALNQIENDFHISTEEVNLTVTVYLIFQAISPTFWGTIADSYGRRLVLIGTVSVYCGSCIGLALAPNYAALLVLRMLQAFGSSSVIAVGAGIVGDVADRKKRGSYYGFYSIGQLLGPVIGPVVGGIVAQKLSWRWLFWILLILGAISVIAVSLFVQETLRSLVGNGSGYHNPTPSQWLARRRGKLDEAKIEEIKKNRKPVKLNFFQPFLYTLQPDVAVLLIFSGLHYSNFYSFLSSTTKQFSIHYGLNELQIGLCFLCAGVGTIVGAALEGKILDRDYKIVSAGVKETDDFPIFRARFRTLWIHMIIVQALTILYGWCFKLNAHIAVMLIIQFFVSASTVAILTCSQTLLVDLYPTKGASISASNNLIRCILGAIATVYIDPGIEGVGIGWMFTIIAFVLIVSNISVPVILKYGPKWKKRRTEKEAYL